MHYNLGDFSKAPIAMMEQKSRRFPKWSWPVATVTILVAFTIFIITQRNESRLREMCQLHFKRAADLTREATVAGNKLLAGTSVISEVVMGGETFLDYCMNPDLPLSAQPEQSAELSRLAHVIPAEFRCAQSYKPVVQLIDLDKDGVDETVLHTRALRCDGDERGFGGLSIVFGKDRQSRQWYGSVIWPCFGEDCDYWAGDWVQNIQPLVQRLDICDAEGNSYFLVSGGYLGADARHEFIVAWRWDGAHATQALLLHLSDWCGWPIKWEVPDENRIVVPATGATSRCKATPTRIYALQGDKFTLVEQSSP